MEKNYLNINNLKVSSELAKFIEEELLKNTDISAKKFWLEFDRIVHELAPKNKMLLKKEKIYKKKLMNGILLTKAKKIIFKNTKNF